MKTLHACALVVASVFSACASAQNIKPGLWEVTHSTKGGSPEMEKGRAQAQQHMANMPPAERKMMEDMMAKRGIKMGAGGPGGMSATICMTKEMIERQDMPAQQGNCQTTKQPRSGNTMKFSFSCAQPPSSGEGLYTFTSPEAYSMKMTISRTVHGKPETMNMEGSGKWLSADCGDVKPMRPPNTK